MAHFILEYSSNLQESEINVDLLFEKLHRCAIDSRIFPIAGIRSRALVFDQYRIADGDPELAFVNLSVKVGSGRDLEVRKRIGKQLFDVLAGHLQPVFDHRRVAVSFEMRELDPDVKFNKNNIHEKFVESHGSP
jgi:5-carboxymethyl-2-hydroxymuconate isomerase